VERHGRKTRKELVKSVEKGGMEKVQQRGERGFNEQRAGRGSHSTKKVSKSRRQ